MSSTTQPAADWHRGRVASWLVSVDHKRIGALYLGWAGVFFVIAGVLTVLMRLQMTRPDASILGSGTYRGVLTMHGTLLVFFVLLPVVTGLATYIVPLMIGARTIAMPGTAAVALWLFVFGGAAVTLSAFAGGGASQAGWTGLPPLALAQQGNGVDLWLMGLLLLAISLLLSATNLIATIRALRMEGMEWSNAPVFAWAVYVWSWLSIVLVPIAALGLLFILLERSFSGSFDFFLDGDTVEPKLIWLFGQSFAYAALVPIFGILAELVAVFAGRSVANARLLGQALVGIGGLTLVLVLYHAYSTGIGSRAERRAPAPRDRRDDPFHCGALAPQEHALERARVAPLDGTAPLRGRRDLPLCDRPPVSARPRDLRQRSRSSWHGVRRRARPLPPLGHGPPRDARRRRLLVAEDLRPAARGNAHPLVGRSCSSSDSTARSSFSSCSAIRDSRAARRASALKAAHRRTTRSRRSAPS